ncbi:hypothetical protein EJ644_09230, partial [Campylobacter jejuni]|nr:hypothetical protein [Campylobacter jejuni]
MIYKRCNFKLAFKRKNDMLTFDGISYNIKLPAINHIILSIRTNNLNDFRFYYRDYLINKKLSELEEEHICYRNKKHIILYLNQRLVVKLLKITTKSKFTIKIYIQKHTRYFLAALNGGFGDRIITMMNAIYLAKYTKSGFGFYWDKLNDDFLNIESEEYMFSSNFIDRYSFTSQPDVLYNCNMSSLDQINKFSELIRQPFDYYCGFYVNHYHFINNKIFYNECDKLFKKIQFSDNINKIINNSKYIFNSNFTNRTIAIHLRRGDMIYSEYRFFHYQYLDKSMPNEILLELVNKNKDKNILLFGEDEKDINNIIDYFKNENINIKSCKNFIPEYISNQTELAIFEIIFMSQCMEIYSYSGFARLASMIKNKKEPNLWLKYFSYEDICHIIEKNLNKIKSDNLQLAYSLFCLFKLSYELNKDNKYLIDILNKAIFYDNNNVLLKLFLIKLLVLEKKYYKADNLAKECY